MPYLSKTDSKSINVVDLIGELRSNDRLSSLQVNNVRSVDKQAPNNDSVLTTSMSMRLAMSRRVQSSSVRLLKETNDPRRTNDGNTPNSEHVRHIRYDLSILLTLISTMDWTNIVVHTRHLFVSNIYQQLSTHIRIFLGVIIRRMCRNHIEQQMQVSNFLSILFHNIDIIGVFTSKRYPIFLLYSFMIHINGMTTDCSSPMITVNSLCTVYLDR
jgi:hypothetical protein